MSASPVRLPYSEDLRAILSHRLDDMERRALPVDGLRRAAVALVVLPDDAGRASVVLTRRADHLGRHQGQFALPGGRVDAGETWMQAALRELHEEVGFDVGAAGPGDDHEAVLGRLDDFVTRSGYHMTPVVVWGGEGVRLEADPGEVAEIFRVPLERIADPERRMEQATDDPQRPLLALQLVDTWIFAPTAAVLLQLGDLAVHDRVLRVAHYEQPRFAWK